MSCPTLSHNAATVDCSPCIPETVTVTTYNHGLTRPGNLANQILYATAHQQLGVSHPDFPSDAAALASYINGPPQSTASAHLPCVYPHS